MQANSHLIVASKTWTVLFLWNDTESITSCTALLNSLLLPIIYKNNNNNYGKIAPYSSNLISKFQKYINVYTKRGFILTAKVPSDSNNPNE